MKKGDLAIFWDDDPRYAVIDVFTKFTSYQDLFPYVDGTDAVWKNAIKLESKEQYERFIKGEI